MQHHSFPFLHVQHRRAGQRPAIGRLAAAFRIERAAVQHRGGPAAQLREREEAGGEAGQVRVAQVQALGHGGRILWSAATKDRVDQRRERDLDVAPTSTSTCDRDLGP